MHGQAIVLDTSTNLLSVFEAIRSTSFIEGSSQPVLLVDICYVGLTPSYPLSIYPKSDSDVAYASSRTPLFSCEVVVAQLLRLLQKV